MKKTLKSIFLTAATLSLATSCNTANRMPGQDSAPIQKGDLRATDKGFLILSDEQRDMIEKNNDFALKLFKETTGLSSYVVSPLSVTYLMGILANGADGTTRQEILKTLGMEGCSVNNINELCKGLLVTAGKEDPSIQVEIANYVAVNKNYRLKDNFVKVAQTFYDAGIESLDFASSKTTNRINDWCSKHTDVMIPRIVEEVDPSAVSYLMNAIFFNGTWTDKFDKKETKEENFRGYTRNIQRVKMMHRNDEMFYAANDTYAAVNLPYGDRSYSMTILLPNEGKSVDDVLKTLSPQSLNKLNRSMERYSVDLKLPRFTTKYDIQLNDILSKLGAKSLFQAEAANLSNFADGSFYVSKMLQKAKIEVSEEGTKAAAVTAAIVGLSALAPEPQKVNFHANRPFVYFIQERNSGAIFFMGQYTGD